MCVCGGQGSSRACLLAVSRLRALGGQGSVEFWHENLGLSMSGVGSQ